MPQELLHGTVTLFFTDVEDSTPMVGRLGPERYAETLDLHRAILRRALAQFGGREVDSRGEESFAVFARAQDAVSAAVAVERAHAHASWPDEAEIKVRIGIHTGEPALRDGGYLGLDVHRGARICSAGHGGQVLLSQTSYALAVDAWQEDVRAKDLGEHVLKGVDRPERIYQLVADGLTEEFPPLRSSPTVGRFVGDEEDLAAAASTTASPRRRAPRLHLRRRDRPLDASGLVEEAWHTRAQIASADEALRRPFAELAASLFNGARSMADADHLLADVDWKRLERRLAECRELAVVSQRAAAEVARITAAVELVEGVAAAREQLVAAAQRAPSDPTAPETVVAAGAAIRDAIGEVDAAVESARTSLGPTALKLHRTRHRGIYTHGSVYVVPSTDELGMDAFREFATLQEARNHQKASGLDRASDERLGGGAPHDFGVAYGQGYMPVRDERRGG